MDFLNILACWFVRSLPESIAIICVLNSFFNEKLGVKKVAIYSLIISSITGILAPLLPTSVLSFSLLGLIFALIFILVKEFKTQISTAALLSVGSYGFIFICDLLSVVLMTNLLGFSQESLSSVDPITRGASSIGLLVTPIFIYVITKIRKSKNEKSNNKEVTESDI